MKAFQLISLILCCVYMCGCAVVCTNPLPNADRAKPDQRLLGRWMLKTDEGTGYIQFDSGPNQTMTVSTFGDKLTPDQSDRAFTMFTTRLGNYDYMNLRFGGPRGDGYFIVRYSVTTDKLAVWFLAGDKIKRAIDEGKLKGEEKSSAPLTAITITDSSAKISAFIETSSDDLFFHCADLQKVRN